MPVWTVAKRRAWRAGGQRRRVPAALAAAAVTAVVAAAASGPAAGRPTWDGCTPKAGDVSFRASDGTRLAGHRFGRGRVAVVLAHQSRGTLCQWADFGRRLDRLGYLAFAFDFRNLGSSQKHRLYPEGQSYGADVEAAVRAVRRMGARKVLLVGASLGGAAVLDAASRVTPPVAGVVSVSAPAELSDALEHVPQLTMPVLYLVGSGDREFAAEAQRLYDATRTPDKKLVVLDDSRHGTVLVSGNAAARRGIEAFLAAHRG
jgi:alpha-beta hydrolase superfamily lysophospholipase